MNSHRHNPRSASLRLALCIVAGAFTTLAVATAFSAFAPLTTPGGEVFLPFHRPGEEPSVCLFRHTCLGVERRLWTIASGQSNRQLRTSRTLDDTGDAGSWGRVPAMADPAARKEGQLGVDAASGWPALAFWCEVEHAISPTGTVMATESPGGLPLSMSDGSVDIANYRCVPLRPIWPGLALDTALYAALWAVPLTIVPFIRGAVRARRGLCRHCGYDLIGNLEGGCPECGAGR